MLTIITTILSCSSTKINNLYKENTRENLKAYYPVKSKTDYEKSGIYIFEANTSDKAISDVKVNYNNIQLKNISKNKGAEDNSRHIQLVVDSFLDRDNDYTVDRNQEDLEINLGLFQDFDIRKNVKGIINMSYGWITYNNNMKGTGGHNKSRYINGIIKNNIIEEYFSDDFSNLLFDEKYKENRQLKIKALGNRGLDNIYDPFITNDSHILYESMSPEIQSASRSEIIFVKNMIAKDPKVSNNLTDKIIKIYSPEKKIAYTTSDGTDFYEVEYDGSYNVKPYLLRSFSVVDRGFIIDKKGEINAGSSFSSPKVARLSYEISKKFPFLTYHQIKEVILTTAKNDGSGYLNNIVGWGIVDKDKAMNGLSDLNAGLIEESRFFEGMNDKIYDKEGNIYQYLDIKEGKYEFSNNIVSGLKGDGNNKEDIIYNNIRGSDYENFPEKYYTLRLPKVLDSEKNFYANVKQAGLRKDGKGELVLSGKQDYSTKTQILNGTITLKNNSLSKYEVFNKGILNLEGNNIKIENDILNDGKTIFNANNTTINNYKASSNSETVLNTSKIVNATSFKTNGKIKINIVDVEDLDKIKTLVKSNNIDIKDSYVSNIYLDNISTNGTEIVLKINENKLVNNLSVEELRNLPTYNYNEKKFFDHFNNNKNILRNLLNLSSHNIDKTKSQLFTSNYSNFVNNYIENNKNLIYNYDILNNNNLSIYYNNLYQTNLVKSDTYSSFNNNLFGNLIGINKKSNNLNFGIFISNYINKINYTNDSNLSSFNYQIGTNLGYQYNKFEINNNFNYTLGINKLNRKLLENDIFSKFYTHFISNSTTLSYLEKHDKNEFAIFTKINLMNLKLDDIEEKSEYNDLVLNIKNNNIFKMNWGLGLIYNREINKYLTITNQLKFDLYNNKEILLNASIEDTNFKLKGKDLENYNLMYTLGININSDKLNFNFKTSLDNKLKLGISTTLKYEF